MNGIKKHFTTIILILLLITGISLLLYPTISNYWNSFHQSQAIASYAETVTEIDQNQYEQILKEASEYNLSLADKENRFLLTEEETEEYESLLNVTDTGIMGYVEIPKINLTLPIYHGTSEEVLQVAIGHIPGSSLPIGGKGTHCVISGHRGLASAKLFTNLDTLEIGDTFLIRVLDEALTYEVDQIRIVEPDEISDLEIDPEMDYCTLVTCTPYRVNSHRLLVRGHRIANAQESSVFVTADALQISTKLVAVILTLLMLFLLIVVWLSFDRALQKKKKKK
jgi:sortase A